MKKIYRVACALIAAAFLATCFSCVFALDTGKGEAAFQGAAERLFLWGIIDEADLEIIKNGDSKKIDRHVFALWSARVLSCEFEAEKHLFFGGKGSELCYADECETGYTDVDASPLPLYRRAIAYVTENGIFRGYGKNIYGENNFGAYREDGVPERTNGVKNGGKLELYQALVVLLRLLSRADGELDTSYIDDAKKYSEFFGNKGEALRSEAAAYLWKSLSLGIVDKTYTSHCTEYSWDAELTYAEAAYLMERAVAHVNPAVYRKSEYTDADGDGVGDLCLASSFGVKRRKALLRGVITAVTDKDGDGILDIDGTVSVKLKSESFGEITVIFSEDEFDDIALASGKQKLVSVAVGNDKGYPVGTEIEAGYYGNLLPLWKSTLSPKDEAEIKSGLLNACRERNGELGEADLADTLLPKSRA